MNENCFAFGLPNGTMVKLRVPQSRTWSLTMGSIILFSTAIRRKRLQTTFCVTVNLEDCFGGLKTSFPTRETSLGGGVFGEMGHWNSGIMMVCGSRSIK